MRKFSQPQNPNPTDLRVQRRHKKRAGKVERDTARVFYMRLSQVRLKIQFNNKHNKNLRERGLKIQFKGGNVVSKKKKCEKKNRERGPGRC